MDAFIEKLANIAWILVLGGGLIIGLIWAAKKTFLSIKATSKKHKLDLWLEEFGDLVGGINDQTFIADLEKAVSDLESGNDSEFRNNDEFFALTEVIMLALIYNRLKPIQNEKWAPAEEGVIKTVKRVFYYLTRSSGHYKMDSKIFMATKYKKGFDLE